MRTSWSVYRSREKTKTSNQSALKYSSLPKHTPGPGPAHWSNHRPEMMSLIKAWDASYKNDTVNVWRCELLRQPVDGAADRQRAEQHKHRWGCIHSQSVSQVLNSGPPVVQITFSTSQWCCLKCFRDQRKFWLWPKSQTVSAATSQVIWRQHEMKQNTLADILSTRRRRYIWAPFCKLS